MKSIGEFLKAKRLEKDLSLRDVAKATGISHVHIGAIERGESATTFEKAIALLNLYKVTTQELERETGYTLKNNTIMSAKMPDDFIKRLNEDIQKQGDDIWDKISISKQLIQAALTGRGILSRKDVIELAKTLEQPVSEYLLLSEYLPEEFEVIKHSSAFEMFRTLNKLSPDEIDQVIDALKGVLNLLVQGKTKKEDEQERRSKSS